jgi:hypothetical protein
MNARTPTLVLASTLAVAGAARAGEVARTAPPGPGEAASFMRSMAAARRTGPITLDGKLDEAAWQVVPWGDRFTQVEPDEAAPASVATRFKILWDDEAIYVGVECDDPEKPVARLSRRDRYIDADYVSFDFDTTYDRRTAYHFLVYAAGQQVDGLHFNDTELTTDWDAAWESAVVHTDRGWSFEAKIPLRVLRIPDGARKFGFNIYRHLTRRHEEDQWRYRPRGTPGDISQLGLLTGLEGIRPVRALELRPYFAARTTVTTPAPSDVRAPAAFSGCASMGTSGSTVSAACVGGDLRYSLASDLSLVATVNPDFGQVEADARVLNLTTYETFFPEKRPFFLEGLDLFKSPLQVAFGSTFGGSPYDIFYSRRIGRQLKDPDLASGERLLYRPAAQTVATALKLTGTIGKASVGFLSALEPRSYAQVLDSGHGVSDRLNADAMQSTALRVRTPVGANAILGFTGTGVDPLFAGGARHEHVASADFTAFDSQRDYGLQSQVAGSLLSGGPSQVLRDGTVLEGGSSGLAASAILRKDGGAFNFQFVGDYLSPQFEVNGLGFLRRANMARALGVLFYNDVHPGKVLQRWNFNVSGREVHDARLQYELYRAGGPEFYFLFNNYWNTGGGVQLEASRIDDRELADGTLFRRQPGAYVYWNAGTDSRKAVDVSTSIIYRRERGRPAFSEEWDNTINFRPLPQLEGSLETAISFESGTIRRIRKATALPGGTADPSVELDPRGAQDRAREYLLAPLFARSVSATLRGTFAFSPKLTLQAYAQLFTAGVAYGDPLRAVVGPGRQTVTIGELVPASSADAPAASYDDRQVGLNLNLILRWEWRLGSTFYLVYAHQTSNEVTPAQRGLSFSGDLGALSTAQGAVQGDTLLVKVDLLGAL